MNPVDESHNVLTEKKLCDAEKTAAEISDQNSALSNNDANFDQGQPIGFADTVRELLSLPLTPQEKAEAIRLLMGGL